MPGRKALCTGDMFIWASPNCGNPRRCSGTPRVGDRPAGDGRPRAELLLPGHGWPIGGAGTVAQVLTDAADLDSLVDQTLAS